MIVVSMMLTPGTWSADAQAAPLAARSDHDALRLRSQSPVRSVPFSAISPWLSALPVDAPLDPHSSAIARNLQAQIQQAYGHAALNSWDYSAPIYTVPRAEPLVNVHWNNCQDKTWEAPAFAAALHDVPVPRNAVSSMGTDGEMVIWQPSTNTEWEFWKAERRNGQLSACWGGRIQDVTHSDGAFTDGTGATASGLPLLGFLIRVSDLRSGAVNHVINLEVPDARASLFSWPAQRTDGWKAGADYPAEGERFRLPASLDLAKFDLSPGEMMIARAMQRYGMIVTDQSGAVSIQAEDPGPFELHDARDPYAQYFSGPQYSWLDGIPWQHLQALAWNYGAPGSGLVAGRVRRRQTQALAPARPAPGSLGTKPADPEPDAQLTHHPVKRRQGKLRQ